MDELLILGSPIGAAIMFSLAGFASKYTKQEAEEFDLMKVVSTMIVGAIVGVVMLMLGVEPTESNFELYIAETGFFVVILYYLLNTLKHKIEEYKTIS